jgi:GxxExxY protein
MTHNEISGIIIDVAMKLHIKFGPGVLESVYLRLMEHELRKRGLRVQREFSIPVIHDGMVFDVAFRADLLVEDMFIVELKSIEQLAPVHRKQLLTYLRLADKRLGLLINFGAEHLRDGIARVVNGLPE